MDSKKNRFFFIQLFIRLLSLHSCGNSATYCGAVAYGNCGVTACGAGLCCTRYG